MAAASGLQISCCAISVSAIRKQWYLENSSGCCLARSGRASLEYGSGRRSNCEFAVRRRSFSCSSKQETRTDGVVDEKPTNDVAESSNRSLSLEDLNKAVRKTATTFAPRSSTARKNPAFPGSTLYTVFEVQAYLSMVLGGALAFNLLFPSDHADIWRLMGMWSVWMFTIPSLRARDCSSKEKDALNYLFIAIPLINIIFPIFWKSFAAVWSADVLVFFAMYAWKLDWLSGPNKVDS